MTAFIKHLIMTSKINASIIAISNNLYLINISLYIRQKIHATSSCMDF